jgi:hypothetical protein
VCLGLSVKQDIDFTVLASSSQGYLPSFWICLFDLWSMSPIVDSISIRVVNQRVISGHRLEIERVMVLPTHVTVTDHSPDFFLFSGGRSIPWAALAFLRARKSVNVSFGRWRVRCECGAGDDSPVLSWLLQYGC